MSIKSNLYVNTCYKKKIENGNLLSKRLDNRTALCLQNKLPYQRMNGTIGRLYDYRALA